MNTPFKYLINLPLAIKISLGLILSILFLWFLYGVMGNSRVVGTRKGPVIIKENCPPSGYKSIEIHLQGYLDPGEEGQNKTWDFSYLKSKIQKIDSSNYISTINCSESPFYNQFNTANLCIQRVYNHDTTYIYFITSENSLSDTAYVSAEGKSIIFNETKVELKFPFSWGESVIKMKHRLGDTYAHADTVIYDSWGTLITPFGAYENVVRLHYIDGSGFPNYEWWSVKPYFTIMCYFPPDGIKIYVPESNHIEANKK